MTKRSVVIALPFEVYERMEAARGEKTRDEWLRETVMLRLGMIVKSRNTRVRSSSEARANVKPNPRPSKK